MKKLITKPLTELMAQASAIRRAHFSSQMDLCSIINAKSGSCTEDCKFCAQSSHHKTDINKYPLKDFNDIFTAAKKAKEIGAKRFGIVTSGDSLNDNEVARLSDAIKAITQKLDMCVCGSLGALSEAALLTLKESGMSRYHHNIETSPQHYSNIVTTHSFDARIRTIRSAKSVGLEVCSGVIIGMGESWDDRIEMATTLKGLDVDSVPINFLVPIKGTPMESSNAISCADAIRTICIFRIVLPNKVIRIAAGRESILKDFQAMAFAAGANGMLIGGYLTIKGRHIGEDINLVKEVESLWNA